jgi:hypothetical protein|tara:strand:+ start:1256 stop:2491 length:1236 start_codon:yes stop_codon:yes gene_type:complete
MKGFTSFLAEAKNTHMEHIEDNILNAGVDGARQSLNFLRAIRDMLSGNSKSSVNISVKWDGAPAIFAGIDPSDGKFFVAKKGIFNKNPKIYKSLPEIVQDTSGDLAEKLNLALQLLPSLGIKGVIQGDFLFSNNDLKSIRLPDGDKAVTFHPNTIVYAIPYSNKEMVREIINAKIGIVWHTKYVGTTFEDMSAQFGVPIVDSLNASKDVWMVDALYQDVSGTATMTKKQTDTVTKMLSDAGTIFQKIKASTLNGISENDELLMRMKTFLNTKVRAGKKITNVRKVVTEMIDYFHDYYEIEKGKRKTEKGKGAVNERKKEVMKFFSKTNASNLQNILLLMNAFVDIKELLIKQMNKTSTLKTFLSTEDGYKVTGQEGYVAIDKLGKNAVKLVDRMEFSKANFSDKVLKGWQK